MSISLLYATAGALTCALALFAVAARRDLLGRILAVNVLTSGVFLVLLALARRGSAGGPDPVPQALVLTGIVVSVSGTAFALALARRARADEPSDEEDA